MNSEDPSENAVPTPTAAPADLSGAIIAAATEIHRALGPGFPAAIYEGALCVDLERAGVPFEREKYVPVFYREKLVGEYRPGLVVSGKVAVELKTAKAIEPIDFGIVRWSLKALDLESALILNFATAPITIRRIERDTY